MSTIYVRQFAESLAGTPRRRQNAAQKNTAQISEGTHEARFHRHRRRHPASAVIGLALLPGVLEGQINRIVEAGPIEVPDEARVRHGELAVVDLHADTLLWARDPLERANRGHVDVPRLADGNVTLQVFSVVTKVPRDQRYTGTSGDSDSYRGKRGRSGDETNDDGARRSQSIG